MTADEQQQILYIAYNQGVEVRWAKKASDIEEEGVHIMEPNYTEVVLALHEAILHKVGLVMIHSKLTWARR